MIKKASALLLALVLSFSMVMSNASYAIKAEDTAESTVENTAQPDNTASDETADTALSPALTQPESATPVAQPEAVQPVSEVPVVEEPTVTNAIYVDGDAGDDARDGTGWDSAVKTFQAGLAKLTEGGTLYVGGNFTGVNNITIPGNVNLIFGKATTMTGTGNGITVQSGSTVSATAPVSMNGYGTALTISNGATLTDGNYTFDNVNTGLNLQGVARGSSQENLHITITAKTGSVGYETGDTTTLDKVTLIWNGGNVDGWTWRNLVATDSHIEITKVWLFPSKFNLTNSYFKLSDSRHGAGGFSGGQAMAFYGQGTRTLTNSEMVVDGSRINIVVGSTFVANNSTITIQNSPDGGFNVNDSSTFVVNNTTLISKDNESQGFLTKGFLGVGISSPASLKINGSSKIETPANRATQDSVGKYGESTYVVTGGSFKVYEPQTSSQETQPTNGKDNGNEGLTFFKLADPAINALNVMNSKGGYYTYDVANATSDGQKRVWLPAMKVTYKLDNDDATFTDGTSANKTYTTYRGGRLSDVVGSQVEGVPTDKNGVEFLGWFYKDDKGVEHAFDGNAVVPSFADGEGVYSNALTVYAKWNSKLVAYHNGKNVDYLQSVANTESSVKAKSYDQITKEKDSFAYPGKVFVSWNTKEDGSGETINPNEDVNFEGDNKRVDLYAQYTDAKYKVSFSANGGYFSDDSYFATHTDLFDVTRNSDGKITKVTLKKEAKYNDILEDLLPEGTSLSDVLVNESIAKKDGWSVKKKTIWFSSYYYWYKDTEASSTGFYEYSSSVKITDDTTYYVGWSDDTSIPTIEANNLELAADMFGSDSSKSTQPKLVFAGDEDLSITGAIDVSSIKEKIQALQEQFSGASPEDIELSQQESTFTAKLVLPEGVNVDESKINKEDVKVTGLGSAFEVSDVSLSGKTVTVTFTLKSGLANFAQLKEAVLSTGSKPASSRRARAVNASDYITITVGGLSIDKAVADGSKLTATGSVTGNYFAFAKVGDTTKRFRFNWNAVQDESLAESGTEGLAYSFEVPSSMNLELPGDMLIGDDTANASTIGLYTQDDFALTGELDVTKIQDQIKALHDNYVANGQDPNTIQLASVKSSFVATLRLPEKIDFDKVKASFTDNDLFELGKVEAEPATHTVVVHLELKKSYDKFMDLYNDVTGVPSTLVVTVDGFSIAKDTNPSEILTTVGTVTGTFQGIATSASGSDQGFNLKWNAVQREGGKDSLQTADDNRTISLSVQPREEANLPADLLISVDGKEDSSESAVPVVKEGQDFNVIGRLDVSSIKDRIKEIAGNSNGSGITLRNVSSTFVAILSGDDTLVLPEDLEATLTDNDLFEISDVSMDNQGRVVVIMELKHDYDNFADLYKDVTNVPDYLDVTLKHVKFADGVAGGTRAKLVGEVYGIFDGNVNLDAIQKAYHFAWLSTQMKGLKDSLQTQNDTDITLTVELEKKANMPTENSEKTQSIKRTPKTATAVPMSAWLSLALVAAMFLVFNLKRRFN